jgi:hypothetical protein
MSAQLSTAGVYLVLAPVPLSSALYVWNLVDIYTGHRAYGICTYMVVAIPITERRRSCGGAWTESQAKLQVGLQRAWAWELGRRAQAGARPPLAPHPVLRILRCTRYKQPPVCGRHQIESPKRSPQETAQGRLPLTRLSKIRPFVLVFQTVWGPRAYGC